MNTIQGVLAAALTPRRPGEAVIDLAAALELIEFLESRGVDGIVLLGSTGEFPHFTPEDRIRLAAMAAKRSRVPILVNASHSTLDSSLEIARQAIGDGAAGVLLAPPYYYRYTQESIRAYFLEFAAQLKAPVYLYNIPRYNNEIQIQTALDLLSTGAFAGIKDSTGEWENFAAIQPLAAARGLSVFVGSERIYSRACRAGAAGAISGVATILPELIVAIDRRARRGEDTSSLDALAAEFLDRTQSFSSLIAHREAAAIRGLKCGPPACPPGSEECRRLDEFRSWFRDWLAETPAQF